MQDRDTLIRVWPSSRCCPFDHVVKYSVHVFFFWEIWRSSFSVYVCDRFSKARIVLPSLFTFSFSLPFALPVAIFGSECHGSVLRSSGCAVVWRVCIVTEGVRKLPSICTASLSNHEFNFSRVLWSLEVESLGPEGYLVGVNPTARLEHRKVKHCAQHFVCSSVSLSLYIYIYMYIYIYRLMVCLWGFSKKEKNKRRGHIKTNKNKERETCALQVHTKRNRFGLHELHLMRMR